MRIVLTIIFSSVFCMFLHSQQTVSSTGGDATGGGGTVSYTVGQSAYITITGSNGSVTQGVQQPFEISVITSLEEARDITLVWSAYPNPATDYLRLTLKNPENSGLNSDNLSYNLYDSNGKLLLNEKLYGFESTISMGEFPAGIYFLKVSKFLGKASQKELKTFKIIKH
jgi:hypothetical protein